MCREREMLSHAVCVPLVVEVAATARFINKVAADSCQDMPSRRVWSVNHVVILSCLRQRSVGRSSAVRQMYRLELWRAAANETTAARTNSASHLSATRKLDMTCGARFSPWTYP